TDEVTGVLPIPDDVRIKSAMAQFEASLDSERPHHHLAALQGTRKAVLPVHNQEEKDLFRELMSGNNSFGNFSSDVQVEAGVKIWNAEADRRDDIYYKLAEQLKVYYTGDWQRSSNTKQTKATTASTRQPLMKRIHDPNRLQMVPQIPETTLTLHHVPSGMLSFDSDATDTSLPAIQPSSPAPAAGISTLGPFSGTSDPSAVAPTQFIAGSSSGAFTIDPQLTPPAPKDPAQPQILNHLAKRKVTEVLEKSRPAAKKPRHTRTCRKCAIESCPGKGKVDYCVNTCRDCGKGGKDKSCIGRNPKFPDKSCTEAKW
ncbi:hypothetical protein FB451DRAFT_1043554, partial [Mycena latifolia]